MRPATISVLLSLTMLAAAGAGLAAGVAGRWVAEDEPSVTLTLQESTDGGVMGTLADPGMSLPLRARTSDRGFAGALGVGDEAVAFTATVEGDRLILDLGDGEQLTFRRSGESAQAAATAPDDLVEPARNVVINGKRMSAEELTQVERFYSIHIPDADYWYDPVLGAWGVEGSPTLGFIAPGLPVGGALRPDASGRGTNVFVNGRELHVHEVMVLQQLAGPIPAGRYFITADGLAGYEGGPPVWNLAALAAQSGGGGSNTWQSRITGASGFSDGTTSAVFLPNGGIVSTGN